MSSWSYYQLLGYRLSLPGMGELNLDGILLPPVEYHNDPNHYPIYACVKEKVNLVNTMERAVYQRFGTKRQLVWVDESDYRSHNYGRAIDTRVEPQYLTRTYGFNISTRLVLPVEDVLETASNDGTINRNHAVVAIIAHLLLGKEEPSKLLAASWKDTACKAAVSKYSLL